MKRHITIIALALISLATVFSGCKKDENHQSEQKEKYTIRYEVNNVQEATNPLTGEVTTFTLSPCFKANITYTDANGQSVELKDITLPWEKEINIEAPFNAILQTELTFNEEELSEEVTVVKFSRIGSKKAGENSFSYYDGGGAASAIWQKNKFLERIEEHPEYLTFSMQHSIN